MSDNRPSASLSSNRKKSGAENRKAKKGRQDEDKQLGSFMLKYLQPNEGTSKSVEEPEAETLSCAEETLGAVGGAETENKTSVKEYQQYTEQEKDLAETEAEAETSKSGDEEISELPLPEGCDDTEEAETSSCLGEKHSKEYFSNTKVLFDKASGAIDPASLVGLKLSTEEKAQIIKMKPCQPNASTLQLRKKQIGDHFRYSPQRLMPPNENGSPIR